jgi:hypothetical protein
MQKDAEKNMWMLLLSALAILTLVHDETTALAIVVIVDYWVY